MNVTTEIVEKSPNSTLTNVLTSVSPIAYNVLAAVEPAYNETNSTVKLVTGIPIFDCLYFQSTV